MIEVQGLAKRFVAPGTSRGLSLRRPPPRIVQAVQDVGFRAPDGGITQEVQAIAFKDHADAYHEQCNMRW